MIIPFPNYLKLNTGVFYGCLKFDSVDDVLKTLTPAEAENMAAFQARYGLEWVQRLRAAYRRQA